MSFARFRIDRGVGVALFSSCELVSERAYAVEEHVVSITGFSSVLTERRGDDRSRG